MAKAILDKHAGLVTARGLWNGLTSSSARVGRYSDLIDLSALRYPMLQVHVKVKANGTPTQNKGVHLFWLQHDGDGTNPLADDGATWDANNMAAQSSLTEFGARFLGSLWCGGSPSSGMVLGPRTFTLPHPGVKGAFLLHHDLGTGLSSDDQEVVNGDFGSDTVWTKGTGWTIAGGVAVHTPTGGGLLTQSGILSSGKTYRVSFEIKNYSSGSIRARLFNAPGVGGAGTIRSGNGVYVEDVVANGADLSFEPIESSADLDIDNVSAVLLEPNAVNVIRWRGLSPELQ